MADSLASYCNYYVLSCKSSFMKAFQYVSKNHFPKNTVRLYP